jgi:L-iduronidase
MYWDATTAGIEDAEAATGAKLYFGGTASGKAAGDTYYLAHMLDHKVQNVNSFNGAPVRWDYITAHVKGQSTSYVTVVGEWAVSELIRSNTDWANAMSTLPISNDEGDPMVGWESPTDWRGDARYAAILPKMVNQHLLAINDNNTVNPLGWLSFDGAFMNGASDNYTGFGMRTMTTRFGESSTNAPVAFVRKNGLAAFTLLSFLGDERCASSGAATPSNVLTANVGVLATKRVASANDAAQATVLIYNSADCTDDVAPSITADITLTGLPFTSAPADGSVVAALYIIDNVLARSPVGAWAAMGSPLVPSQVQLETLWSTAANMTTASLIMPIAVAAGGSVTVPHVTVALPGVAVWHFAEKATAPATPAMPKGLIAFSKAANMSFIDPTQQEVMLRWDCTSVSRVISLYQIEYSASGTAPWVVINNNSPGDIMCSFNHIAPAGNAYYKVSATDYFGRVSGFSTTATVTPWPLFAQ